MGGEEEGVTHSPRFTGRVTPLELFTPAELGFNLRMGLTAEDDINVSPRIVSTPDAGKGKGKSMAPYVEGLVRDYYELCGWDIDQGKPYRKTLKRLDLSEYVEELWGE